MADVKEIGDCYAVAAAATQHLGRYREAEAYASACVERSRGIDAGSYLHGLTWRVAARFMLGDWQGALADQSELERLGEQDPRELPAGYTIRAYAFAALCHELRGERAESDRYIALTRRYFDHRGRLHGGSRHRPPAARALVHRGQFEEALALSPIEPRTGGVGLTLELVCELVAAQGNWDEADRVVAAAREEAEVGEQLSLPLFADRLEGRAAAAAGETERAAALLRRSAEGFAGLGARWEEAWSRLLLGEVLVGGERQPAGRELAGALLVFQQLGSVTEAKRARALLADVAV
jgi:hypothetical protein